MSVFEFISWKKSQKTYERWHLNAKALKKFLGAKKGIIPL